ncbi:MAG: 16S rRNA (uracil(1498)-N(3))-methyltransferase [Candidatus Competibacter sp.]
MPRRDLNRLPRIYLSLPLVVGETVPLDDTAFGHVVRVLRLKPDAALILFDGQGGTFAATLVEVGKRNARARVTEALPREVEPLLRIVLAQGISRGEKMDYTLQKAVELGVTAVQPLFTERAGVELAGERLARKVQHWRGIIISACEQCGRSRLPELREPLALADWLARPAQRDLCVLLDPTARQGLRELPAPDRAVTLLIGPEGGLSPAEIARARTGGFTGIRLGPRILRTETAGVAALAVVQTLWGDWN